MSRFGDDPLAFFDGVYRDVPPWDIGGAQPALETLFDECPLEAPILDVGCGSGDLATALARRGHAVLGVDFVESAVAGARTKAAALPPDVAHRLEFRVGNALQPSRIGGTFRSVVDSGFLHLFDGEERERFVADLAMTLRPGGRYYLLAFAVTFPIANAPLAITVADVRALFGRDSDWAIRVCRSAEFHNRVADPVPATCACIERLGARGV